MKIKQFIYNNLLSYILYVTLFLFMITLAFKAKTHEVMQTAGLFNLIYLFKIRKEIPILKDIYFWLPIILGLLIFLRPCNMFHDYKIFSLMSLGVITGVVARLHLKDFFYRFNLIFPIVFLCNIIFKLHNNPQLSLVDPYNAIYGNKNVFGFFLVIAMLSSLLTIKKLKVFYEQIFTFILSISFFVMSLLNGMRTGVIALIISLLSLVFWKQNKKIIPCLIILIITLTIVVPFIPKIYLNSYISLREVNDLTLSRRITIWKSAVKQIKQAPMWGDSNWEPPIAANIHNSFLQVWVNYGVILGTIHLIYFLGLLIFAAKKQDIWVFTILLVLQTMNFVESFSTTFWSASYFYYIAGVALAKKYIPNNANLSNYNIQ